MESEAYLLSIQKNMPEPHNRKEQKELFLRLQELANKKQGKNSLEYQAIRRTLIEDNIKLVKLVLRSESIKKIRLPVDDKIQMAMLGLICSVDKYDLMNMLVKLCIREF